MERAERLKRLQDLKNNMHVRASERGESDDGIIRIIRDDRVKRIGMDDHGTRRTPSSNMDIIHKHKESDVHILYNDVDDVRSNLPSIHGSQVRSRAGLPPVA
mmetsp:Transcript_37452/g.49262  ORF Transcript_37452/g.49262 Transcript_37452/m.49262 type:complete len:102 (-) Transcript_37452:918-1223(-)